MHVSALSRDWQAKSSRPSRIGLGLVSKDSDCRWTSVFAEVLVITIWTLRTSVRQFAVGLQPRQAALTLVGIYCRAAFKSVIYPRNNNQGQCLVGSMITRHDSDAAVRGELLTLHRLVPRLSSRRVQLHLKF
jgi:hypothetical protein